MVSQRNLTSLLRGWGNDLLDLIYPPHCANCGAIGAWLCDDCCATIPWISYPFCERCGRPQIQGGLCVVCQSQPTYLKMARSLSPHEGALRKAVHGLKYQGVRALAPTLADLLARGWRRYGLEADLIVPAPLAPLREQQRGYNQAALLALALGKQVQISVETGILLRVRETQSQVGLSGPERWQNVFGAFECQQGVGGMRVLVLDDVYTTGATLQACGAALLQGGASDVSALTLTRALDRISLRQQAEIF